MMGIGLYYVCIVIVMGRMQYSLEELQGRDENHCVSLKEMVGKQDWWYHDDVGYGGAEQTAWSV